MSETYELGSEADPPTHREIDSDIGDPAPVFAPPSPPAELIQKRRSRRLLIQGLGAIVALLALAGGLALRIEIWNYTSKPAVALHHGDAATAFDHGDRVVRGDVPAPPRKPPGGRSFEIIWRSIARWPARIPKEIIRLMSLPCGCSQTRYGHDIRKSSGGTCEAGIHRCGLMRRSSVSRRPVNFWRQSLCFSS